MIKRTYIYFLFTLLGTGLLAQPALPSIPSLSSVATFGLNLGNLRMYTYVPQGIPNNAPMVFALHGCGQDAAIYEKETGWNKLADKHQFIVVYPEQDSLNNKWSCFSWFNSSFLPNNELEVLSLKDMVDHMVLNYSVDTNRIYITGLSAGGGMSSTMLANYPATFHKGAVMSGIPYRSSNDTTSALNVLDGVVIKTPDRWADLVKSANPGYTGAYPDVAIFHGTADTVVHVKNADELIKQWTAVNNADQIADSIDYAFKGDTMITLSIYNDSIGDNPVVYYYMVDSMEHGTALDTGACPRQGGQTGKHAFQVDFHSTYWAADFFELMPQNFSISGNITLSKNARSVAFSVPFDSASVYTWTVPDGATVFNGQGTNSITVDFSDKGGLVMVVQSSVEGCVIAEAEKNISIVGFTNTVTQRGSILCNGDATGQLSVSVSGEKGPYGFQWLPGGGADSIASGLEAGTYTLTITDNESYVISQKAYTVSEPSLILTDQEYSLCKGETVSVGYLEYSKTGNYVDTLASSNGCDSIVKTKLVVLPVKTINQTIYKCYGDSLSVGSIVYYTTGDYVDTLVSSNGCDSIVRTDLTVFPEYNFSQDVQLCRGEAVSVGTSSYALTGTYTDLLTSQYGCDSIVTSNISVTDVKSSSQRLMICFNEALSVGTSAYTSSGTYSDTLQSYLGCDSIVTTDLLVLPGFNSSQDISICFGETFTVGSSLYNAAGLYSDTLLSTQGCDSIVSTTLTVFPEINFSQVVNLCYGASVNVGNSIYTTSNTYLDTLAALGGCDSIVVTKVLVSGQRNVAQQYTLCSGDSLVVGASSYHSTGVYLDTLLSSSGCDSIIKTNLSISSRTVIIQNVTKCLGETLNVGASSYSATGVYYDTLTSYLGCDSTVTTNLTIGEAFELSVTEGKSAGEVTLTANQSNVDYKWIDCKNVSVLNETNQLFVVKHDGVYAVQLSKNNCVDTSICYDVESVSSFVGMSEHLLSSSISTYPNPFLAGFNIVFTTAQKKINVQITDKLGAEVKQIEFTGKKTFIERGDMAAGIYFIRIVGENNVVIYRKIIAL